MKQFLRDLYCFCAFLLSFIRKSDSMMYRVRHSGKSVFMPYVPFDGWKCIRCKRLLKGDRFVSIKQLLKESDS